MLDVCLGKRRTQVRRPSPHPTRRGDHRRIHAFGTVNRRHRSEHVSLATRTPGHTFARQDADDPDTHKHDGDYSQAPDEDTGNHLKSSRHEALPP